jgi:hypothetical protein
MKLSF